MNRIVYKIEDDNNINVLRDLKINEYCPIEDNNGNKIIINKLLLNENKLYLETTYLKVIEVDYDSKKIYLQLPDSHVNFFNELDEISTSLLVNLLNGNSELDIVDLVESLNINYYDLENIQYKSILEENSNILKINIFSNTTIKNKNNTILSLGDVNTGDYVGILLGLDYVSLLVDNNLPIGRTKLYCYFMQIHKQHIYKPETREIIKDWNFSSKLSSENIFLKTNITLNDNIDVKTEVETNQKKINKNLLDVNQNLTHISESNDNQSNSSSLPSINSDSEQNNILNINSDNKNDNTFCFNNDDNLINNSDTSSIYNFDDNNSNSTNNKPVQLIEQNNIDFDIKNTDLKNNVKTKKTKTNCKANSKANSKTNSKGNNKANTTEQIEQLILVEEQKNIVPKKSRGKKIIVETSNNENNEKIIKINEDNQVKPKRGKKKV